MSAFTALVNSVYVLTNRPDLIQETELAVKTATLQLHRRNYFFKDILQVTLQFSTKAYLQEINYKTLFPRYRSLNYLRKYDPAYVLSESGGVGKFFEVKSPTDLLDAYSINLSDVCYVAGNTIQLKSSTPIQYCIIGIYQHPDVASIESYSSWIADEYPTAIIMKATEIIFGGILNNPGRRDYFAQQVLIETTQLNNSNELAEGY